LKKKKKCVLRTSKEERGQLKSSPTRKKKKSEIFFLQARRAANTCDAKNGRPLSREKTPETRTGKKVRRVKLIGRRRAGGKMR